MAHPGKGQAATNIADAAGVNDVKLVQRAYYNGHYQFHGAKVQHVVQADIIMYSFVCLIHRHVSSVLHTSMMLIQLSSIFVDGDQARPGKTVTDKVYR